MPPSRPKVVHVVVAGQIGGAERFLVDLASRPDLSGADHCLALMTPNPKLRAFFTDAGLRIADRGPVREKSLAYLWHSFGPADIAWLGRVLLEEKADLLHAHTFGSHILAARAGLRHRLAVVRTEHGVRHYRDPTCSLFRHWALRHTDRIIAVSAFVARTVQDLAPHARDRIGVVLNGIDLVRFPRTPPPTDGPFTISVISRLEPVKRIAVVVEAVAQVPGVRLNIAGEGSERNALEELARKRGVADRVRFLGHLDDPRPAIAASDVLINATREEGLPLAVLEAAAMQRPTIAFDGGGTPEVVQDRRTGWLVREDTVGAFAAAVAEAGADRARAAEYGIKAREWVDPAFGIDRMCTEYAAVYRDVTRGRVNAWPTS